jgi:hypothetical protein
MRVKAVHVYVHDHVNVHMNPDLNGHIEGNLFYLKAFRFITWRRH